MKSCSALLVLFLIFLLALHFTLPFRDDRSGNCSVYLLHYFLVSFGDGRLLFPQNLRSLLLHYGFGRMRSFSCRFEAALDIV
jgi:hypothetical protein